MVVVVVGFLVCNEVRPDGKLFSFSGGERGFLKMVVVMLVAAVELEVVGGGFCSRGTGYARGRSRGGGDWGDG